MKILDGKIIYVVYKMKFAPQAEDFAPVTYYQFRVQSSKVYHLTGTLRFNHPKVATCFTTHSAEV